MRETVDVDVGSTVRESLGKFFEMDFKALVSCQVAGIEKSFSPQEMSPHEGVGLLGGEVLLELDVGEVV